MGKFKECGRETSWQPEPLSNDGRTITGFTMPILRDGRGFIPRKWMNDYFFIGTFVTTNPQTFKYDDKLDGWIFVPAPKPENDALSLGWFGGAMR